MSQYRFEYEKSGALRKARRLLERELSANEGPTLFRGKDPVTGRPEWYCLDPRPTTRDENGQLNLREMLTCERHGFPSRLRATLVTLYSLIPEAELVCKSIYLTEQTTALYRYFHARFPKVIGSECLGIDTPSKEARNGVRHEDMTALSFAGESLDVAITLEVLEHLPEYRPALREMARVLRPGGLALITVPFDPLAPVHRELARLEPTGWITHLTPPEFHEDSLNPGKGRLCYRYFGWKLLEELREAGFRDVSMLETWDLDAAILGDGLNVICARK